MRTIQYTKESEESEMTYDVTYSISPYKGDEVEFQDKQEDVCIQEIRDTETNQVVEFDEEDYTELIDFIKQIDEDDISKEFYSDEQD